MHVKQVNTLPQTADRDNQFQLGTEEELRRRMRLMAGDTSAGIFSASGDVNVDSSPCALRVNVDVTTAFDVLPGTVVFDNGEYIDIGATDLLLLTTALADTSYVVRLEYAEVGAGPVTASPVFTEAAQPLIVKATPLQMLHIEELTVYNALSAATRAGSVVLGLVKLSGGVLTLDNGRDTLAVSRPWFTAADIAHRLKLGTGVQTDTNVHALSANDLTLADYTLWQALASSLGGVLSKPRAIAKVPGELCTETIPEGNWSLDVSGGVTGAVGAYYAVLGKWPERLIALNGASTSSDPGAEGVAWIVPGTKIIAAYGIAPFVFQLPDDAVVKYTWVRAASLPNTIDNATAITLQQPNAQEAVVAGGVILTTLVEPTVSFADVGVLPMAFNVLIDATGTAYKQPAVLFCGLTLDSMGGLPQVPVSQPRAPCQLRLGLYNYNPALTSVTLRIVGADEAGANVTEDLVWNGPLPATTVSSTPGTSQFRNTTAYFASFTTIQAISRINDGPNTAVTVFAGESPTTRLATAQDVVVARLHWTGAGIDPVTSAFPRQQVDMRRISAGGPVTSPSNFALAGVGGLSSFNQNNAMVEAAPREYVRMENFDDPMWSLDSVGTEQLAQVSGLAVTSVYATRQITLGDPADVDLIHLMFVPKDHKMVMYPHTITVTMTITHVFGTTIAVGTLSQHNPCVPRWSVAPNAIGEAFAIKFTMTAMGENALGLYSGWCLRTIGG